MAAAERPPDRARHPAGHRLRGLPAAGGAQGAPRAELARAAAAELVRAHGTDTLSFFKLRADEHYFFGDDGRAFVGYRIENGVLLLSGDPVGPEAAFRPLLAELQTFARARGLKLGAVGASARMCPLYEELGLKTIYLGDEALIDLEQFSLEGRPIRKVRQSVSRLSKAGYAAELVTVGGLDAETGRAVEGVLERGREGAPERGFSMAMDSIDGPLCDQTLIVLARDEDGAVRGVLHFVPCYGRAAMSLSFMRRDPDTPNGLTEFMVVKAVELLRERGIEEMSLNFAAFAKWIHSPEKRSSVCWASYRHARKPVLPDREPVPLQRQVLPALGAALPRLRGYLRLAAGEHRGALG